MREKAGVRNHAVVGADGLTLHGSVLLHAGVPAPTLRPEQAAMFHVHVP